MYLLDALKHVIPKDWKIKDLKWNGKLPLDALPDNREFARTALWSAHPIDPQKTFEEAQQLLDSLTAVMDREFGYFWGITYVAIRLFEEEYDLPGGYYYVVKLKVNLFDLIQYAIKNNVGL